jgi:hypothetical protein
VNAPLRASLQLYRVIIRLYPDTLLKVFGAEMLCVFEEQIEEEWAARGWAGLLRVWRCVLAEVIQDRAPRLVFQALFGVPMLSLMAASFFFVLFFWASGFARSCR